MSSLCGTHRDNSVAGPYAVEAVKGETHIVHLLTSPTITPSTGLKEERTHYTFGTDATWGRLGKVREKR